LIGRILAHYEITGLLGKGGMGEVYRARDTRLKRDVAMKIVPTDMVEDPARLERFQREAEAVAGLSHPNIVHLYSVEEAEGIRFLTMELVEGEVLDKALTGDGLPLSEVLEIGAAVADALSAAHEKGIVHRDLKPANVMVAADGRVKVLDFGLAKLAEEETPAEDDATRSLPLTAEGVLMGTVPYMSPEQLRGTGVDHRSDLFSLGVLLYELTTGRRPFEGQSNLDVTSSILRDTPPALTELKPDLPRHLGRIVDHCLEKDAQNRYQSALDVRNALRGLQKEIESGFSRTGGSMAAIFTPEGSEALAATRGGRKGLWIGLAGAVVVVAAALGYFIGGGGHASDRESIRSLAVLPFINLSGDPAQEYFSDGFTDELTTTLANLSELKVISRNSAATFKRTDKRAEQIGRELGVDGLVSGSVLRSGNRVRITAQLVSADTEINLWADSYESNESDVLTLQAQVARAIADAIAVRLSPEESARLDVPKAVDPRALDAYLRGRALWNRRTEAAVREGLGYFEAATRIAPGFALAHAGLADSYIILGVYGFEPPRQSFPAAKTAAQHAIELDPSAGEPHASLGDILLHYDWDWEGSDRELRRAITLSPGFATAYHWWAETLVLTGNTDQALEATRRARSLDPLSMVIRASLAQVLSLTGDREAAIAELREAISLDPRFPRTRGELARQLLSADRGEEALVEARLLLEANPNHVPALATLGLCLGATGRHAEAREILEGLDHDSEQRFVPSLDRARITAGLRDREATLRYLEEAVAAREGFLPFLRLSDEFAFLLGDPRYEEILEQIGAPEWNRNP